MTHVGAMLGPYELVAELGHGGMAALFLAQRVGPAGFTRHVAIKVVHREHAADPLFVKMFVDEARLSSRVQHPNVVHVEELGEQDGELYLVMEYVDGVTLADVLRSTFAHRTHIPIEKVVAIVSQVADGLHGAHEATDEYGRPLGLVHRDVTPQNILLSARGHVKVIDFGIARAAGRLTATERGALKGKVAYMTPEQLRGQPVDRTSDVFSLSIVLWELLTTRRLFHSKKESETMAKIRDARVEPPSRYRAEIPAALDQVVLRSLARDRADRFPTAHAFRRALVAAAPQSLLIDASAIAELVRTAARDTLEQRRGSVPEAHLEATIIGPPPLMELEDAEAHGGISDRPGAIAELEADVAQARAGADPIVEVRALGRLIGALIYGGHLERASQLVAQAEEMAHERAPGMRGYVASLRAQIAAAEGDLAARLRAQHAAVELYEEAGWVRRAASAAVNLADIYNQFGAYEAAEHALLEALAHARQLEMPTTEAYALLNLGRALLMQDRFAEAEARLAEARTIGESRAEQRVAICASVYRADMLCRAHRWTAGRAEAERAASLAANGRLPAVEVMALTQLARAALASADLPSALAASERAYTVWKNLGSMEEGEGELFLYRVRALEASGDRKGAARLREEGMHRIESIAVRIADPEWRRRFLRHVPSHAELFGTTE